MRGGLGERQRLGGRVQRAAQAGGQQAESRSSPDSHRASRLRSDAGILQCRLAAGAPRQIVPRRARDADNPRLARAAHAATPCRDPVLFRRFESLLAPYRMRCPRRRRAALRVYVARGFARAARGHDAGRGGDRRLRGAAVRDDGASSTCWRRRRWPTCGRATARSSGCSAPCSRRASCSPRCTA